MSTVALLLVLVAAFLHAGWNLVLHRAPDRTAAIVAAVGICGLALLPAAIADPPAGAWGLVAISALAETSYALALAAAYGRGELSLAYPIGRGTAPLLVVIGGWLVLEQVPGPLEVLGAALLGAGLAVLTMVGREAGRAGAVAFAVVTGASIAVYSVVDARAVRTVSPDGKVLTITDEGTNREGQAFSQILVNRWLPRSTSF